MKLVELLAKELREWPSSNPDSVGQAVDGTLYYLRNGSGVCYARSKKKYAHNTDHATAIVTRADWEAEKARIAGKVDGGWRRHKRKSQPVSDGAVVEIRTRGGEYETCEASCFSWGATGNSQIMAYRIHKPAEQPAPVSEEAIQVGIDAADAGKLTPIAEVKARFTCEPVIYLEQMQEGMTVRFSRFTNPGHRHWEFTPGKEYRVGRIGDHVGPVADSGHIPSVNWGFEFTLVDGSLSDIRAAVEPQKDAMILIRDRIRTLDTQRAELEATYQRQVGEIDGERVELVRRLASEGLALVGVAVQQAVQWPEGAPSRESAPEWATHIGRDTLGFHWFDHSPEEFDRECFLKGCLGDAGYRNGRWEKALKAPNSLPLWSCEI